MKERIFRFKKFSVCHSASAMKVGTDGVTLGAWAQVKPGDRVLDAGCGCGLIGLMLAQRGAAEVMLLDIDPPSVREAAKNASDSPWAAGVESLCMDFLAYTPQIRFDRIVSNPPFFNNGELAPVSERANARHELTLTIDALIRHAAEMLTPQGTLSLIMPPDREADARAAAESSGLKCHRRCELITRPNAAPRRILLEFSPTPPQSEEHSLLYIGSEAYKSLTSPFYL